MYKLNVFFFPNGNTLKTKEKGLLLTNTSSWADILGNLFLQRSLSLRFVLASFNVSFTVTQGDDGRPGSSGPPGLRGPKVCLYNLLINETARVESLVSNPLKQDHLPIMEILFVPKIPNFIQFLPP